jgi:adaptin ear-binding coat-associated protein 1/2
MLRLQGPSPKSGLRSQVKKEIIISFLRLIFSFLCNYRAEEWGLEKPLFTGHLKIFQNDVKLRITLFRYKDESTLLATPENLIQFADCPFQITPGEDVTAFVDSVADSSRYFVLRFLLHLRTLLTLPVRRIKDPNSNRTAFLGIGFRERDTSFDFKNALNEYVRYVDRMNTAEQMAKEVRPTLSWIFS